MNFYLLLFQPSRVHFIDCFSITLDTMMQQWFGRLSSSRGNDVDTSSGAQIEELPSKPDNTFRENGKCVCSVRVVVTEKLYSLPSCSGVINRYLVFANTNCPCV